MLATGQSPAAIRSRWFADFSSALASPRRVLIWPFSFATFPAFTDAAVFPALAPLVLDFARFLRVAAAFFAAALRAALTALVALVPLAPFTVPVAVSSPAT